MMRFQILIFCLLVLLPVSLHAQSDDPPLTLLPASGQNQTAVPNQTVSHDSSELHDIYGPVPISEPVSYLFYAGLLAVLIAVCAILYWLFKRRKQPTPPPVPPWERAMRDLSAVKRYLNPKESLIYLDRSSLILRSYIESRFGVKSTKQTTGEFLAGLQSSSENAPLQTFKGELRNCLQIADMAKFAHHLVAQAELEKIEESIVTFIKKTIPLDHEKGVSS